MTRDVGALGESVLRKWAAEVSAAINKADIDRTGWDFLVEFGIGGDLDRSRPLDLVPSPYQCLIQVKSTDSKRRQVRASLADWLYLVRTPLPAFFLLLQFEHSSECKQAYLIHVGEDLMRGTLKRLRSITAEVTLQELGSRTRTYTASADELLPACDGAAVAAGIRGYIDPDFDTYVANKRRLLETLGYEQESKRLDFTVQVPDSHKQGDPADLLVDFAIGTVSDLEVTHGTITDMRFGIAAPRPDRVLTGGRLSIERVPARSGHLTLRNDVTRDFVVFPCDMYVPSGITHLVPTERMKIRLSVPGGDFVLNPSGGTSPLTIRIPERNKPLPLSMLHSVACLIRFLTAVAEQKANRSCTIHFDNAFFTRFMLNQVLMDSSLLRWAQIIVNVKEVVDRTDIPGDLETEWDELCAQEDAFALMQRCVTKDAHGITLRFTMSPPCGKMGRACIPYVVGVTVGAYRVVKSVLLRGKMQAMGAMPPTEVVMPIDSMEIVDQWILFRDEPLPYAISILLDDAAGRCDKGDVMVRLDHQTAAV